MKQKPLTTNEMLRILNDYQVRYKPSNGSYRLGRRTVSLQTLAVGLQNLGFSIAEVRKMIDLCNSKLVSE